MAKLPYSIFLLVAIITSCGKSDNRQPTSTEAVIPSAVNPTQSNLVASMSDEQILRALGLDPATLVSHRENGKDGHTTDYTNDHNHVFITRSIVTGTFVMRLEPKELQQEWKLGKP
jgi:hypothetical protein